MKEHFGIRNFNDLEAQKKILLNFIHSQNQESQTVLKKALTIAEKNHQGQFRDEGPQYIIHPIRVSNILSGELGLKRPDLLIAGLLHDVVEDGEIALLDIKNEFGEKVSKLVKNITRERPDDETEEEKKINKKKKFEELMAADKDTRLIKCADLLDNVRSWPLIPEDHKSQKKFPRWYQEVGVHYLPTAEKTDQRLLKKMKEALLVYKVE